MEIYVVQQEDTIYSIADKFGISVTKLINDNGINIPYPLVVGQALVIAHPKQVYVVQGGDTLDGIAELFQVTINQLLRNNPDLTNRQFIYPGETIVISYPSDKGSLWVVGYTYPFIRESTLRKTLPNLTYLIIFNYQITDEGELIGSDEDLLVIQTASLFKTASSMVVTAFSITGEVNLEIVYEVLLSEKIQDDIIDNILTILKAKGYKGVNLTFQFINSSNQHLYLSFLTKVTKQLHPEGYSVYLTLNPGLSYNGSEVVFEKINYTQFSNLCDGIFFLSYDWGTIEHSPHSLVSVITTSSLLEYIVSQVPLNKIRIAIPTLGYDWKLPYVAGQSKANVVRYDAILSLAHQMNATIHYDEKSLSAYIEYIDYNNEQHIVRFQDARSIDSSLNILRSYGIYGIGFWNIMNYSPPLWTVINSQYEIIQI